MHAELANVILSNPTIVELAASSDAEPRRSWIQLAKVGSFVSKRYGKFSITRDDLSQMDFNFKNVTPKDPTELPIDYDHLSMDPKKPGDGIAAGWLKNVELRAEGDELWGQVEWTSDGAEKIEKKEYRFVSPSFIKDHTHKNGERIGTTLLAAAITNHPFLEGMKALTLFNFSAMGDLAIVEEAVMNLAEVGQRVKFNPDDEDTVPELRPEERGLSFEIKGVKRDATFVKIATLDGKPYGWYHEDSFVPDDAPRKQEDGPMPNQKEIDMSDINAAAARFEKSVNDRVAGGQSPRDAISLAQDQDEAGAKAYLLRGTGTEVTPEPETVVSLTARDGEGFDELCTRYASERNVPLRDAIHAVGVARPDLAEAR